MRSVLKWCLNNVIGSLLVAIAMLFITVDTFKSLYRALSDSGIGVLAWLQVETPVMNWRLIGASALVLGIAIGQFLVFRHRIACMTKDLDESEVALRRSLQANASLEAELRERNLTSSAQVFIPDRFQSMVLRYFWELEPGTQLDAAAVRSQTTLSTNESLMILEELHRQGLLSDIHIMGRGRFYFLSEQGRKFAAEMIRRSEKTAAWPGESNGLTLEDHAKLGSAMAAKMTEHADAAAKRLLTSLTWNDLKPEGKLDSPADSNAIDVAAVIREVAATVKPASSDRVDTVGLLPESSQSGSQDVADAPAFTQTEFYALRIIADLPEQASLSLYEIKRRGPFTEATTRDALDKLVERGFASTFFAQEPTNPAYETRRWQITDKGLLALKRKR